MGFSAEVIEQHLRSSGVARVHVYEQVASTNTVALARAAESAGGGAELFVAERQTAGRGRGSNRWWSAPGALTFSLLTTPLDLPAEKTPLLALATGVGLCRALEPLAAGPRLAMKWPNDVFLGEKKLAGVLIESASARPRRFVIGVGVNVNNPVADAPSDVRRAATSLVDGAVGRSAPFDLSGVLTGCVRQITAVINGLAGGDTRIADEWNRRSLLRGRRVVARRGDQRIEGVCEAIGADGALEIRAASGLERLITGIIESF